jgi:hypothetical protein
MAEFRVSITQLSSLMEVKAKYLTKIHQAPTQGARAVFTPFSSDAALLEALAKLGIFEAEQERILSVLHKEKTETLTVDISEDVAYLFGWAARK